MSDDQKPGPSTLTCALVGLGAAAGVCGAMYLLGRKDEPGFGALRGAAGELERAVNDYDAAFRRLLAAEKALEPISAAFKATEWGGEEQAELLPRLRAAQAKVKAAQAEADAAMKSMREWSAVHEARTQAGDDRKRAQGD